METNNELGNINAVCCHKDPSDLSVTLSNHKVPNDVSESFFNVKSENSITNISDKCCENICQKISVENSDYAVHQSEIRSEVNCKHSEEDNCLQPHDVNTSMSICNTLNEEKLISNENEELQLSQSEEVQDLQIEQTRLVSEVDNCKPDDNIYVYDSNCSEYLLDTNCIHLVCKAWKEFSKKGENKFLKGCKWAPDGLCILTNCEDRKLRIFDLPLEFYTKKSWPKAQVDLLPDLKKTVQVKEGGRVYDYCWYPLMNSQDPPSCCFVSSATDEPVHLWDAFDGKLRASYQSRSYADEIISPFCVTFSPDGEKLFCGFKNKVHLFNVLYPGIKPTSFDIKALSGQSGLVSTIAVNTALPELFAVGTFQKSVGLYSSIDNCGICVLNGHSGGLTHMMFSHDGSCLYTGSRMDSEIVCWDLRNPGKVLFSLCRNVSTNQRIYFDITPDGKHLISGNTDGKVSIWNLESCRSVGGDVEPVEPDFVFDAHKDCSNGISINRRFPILATSSGQRHFPDISGDGDFDDQVSSGNLFDCQSIVNKEENCLKFWWVGPVS